MTDAPPPAGPDLRIGIPEKDLADGSMLVGQVDNTPVLIARRGTEVFAIDATCTHYGGPLAEGLMFGETVRCPWHHACFSLRSGEALAAPALSPLQCWRVDRENGRLLVREKAPSAAHGQAPAVGSSAGIAERVVILGGGAAGFACAEMLRREGFGGAVTVISADESAPYDRPNVSKDYLAGTAPEEWMPLRPPEFYSDHGIDLRLETEVASIDARGRSVSLADGKSLPFDKLLLATGAEPIRLDIPGANAPHVFVLRSLADTRAIIERAKGAKRAVVLGASLIGLEAAAALRAREIDVHVAAPYAAARQCRR